MSVSLLKDRVVVPSRPSAIGSFFYENGLKKLGLEANITLSDVGNTHIGYYRLSKNSKMFLKCSGLSKSTESNVRFTWKTQEMYVHIMPR